MWFKQIIIISCCLTKACTAFDKNLCNHWLKDSVAVSRWVGNPDSKCCVANMGPTWVLAAPGGPHFGPMNVAIRKATAQNRQSITISRHRNPSSLLVHTQWISGTSITMVFRHQTHYGNITDSKVHGANMGPIWGRQDPGGPHVGPKRLVDWDTYLLFNAQIPWSNVNSLITATKNKL